jgi:hypothetical protein
LELEFLSINDFSLFISLEELQHYGDQLLIHWNKEHDSEQQQQQQQPIVIEKEKDEEEEEDGLAPPVRRRARHLSIDKHGDEIDFTTACP